MRVDGAANPDLIHQSGERPDLVADAATPHERCDITNPIGCRNARMGRIDMFHF